MLLLIDHFSNVFPPAMSFYLVLCFHAFVVGCYCRSCLWTSTGFVVFKPLAEWCHSWHCNSRSQYFNFVLF